MLGDAFILEPFTKTIDSGTGSFPDSCVSILEASLDQRPYFMHNRCHVFAATFNRDTKSKHSATTVGRIWGGEILKNQVMKGREDLGGRKRGGKAIDNPLRGLREISENLLATGQNAHVHEMAHRHRRLEAQLRW